MLTLHPLRESSIQIDAPPRRLHSSGRLVLVVEDHDDTRFMLGMLLKMRGFEVVEAGDGEEAIRVAERERPGLILMDATLPRLDGLAATRRIRRLASLEDVPIIFLSGHAEPAFRAVAFEAGCAEYLDKPIDFDQLDDVLERHLGTIRVAETI
ncbi:MAG: response regulator [Acidobacteriota bacterium]|nr:response regulator [Acidobacteriota bacterium]